jgi:hypothetical protein
MRCSKATHCLLKAAIPSTVSFGKRAFLFASQIGEIMSHAKAKRVDHP